MKSVSLVCVLVVLMSEGGWSRVIRVVNRCPHNVFVRTLGNAGLPTLGERELPGHGASHELHFPHGWSGRLWANQSPGATLFEVSMDKDWGQDWYNLSVIDGYNLPMVAGPVGGGGAECKWFHCLHPGCEEAYHLPDDDRRKPVVSSCKGSNYEVTFCP